jgi:type VI protein secretion system component VasK
LLSCWHVEREAGDRTGPIRGAGMGWFWHLLVICVVVIPVAIMWLAVIFEIFRRGDLRWWQRGAWLVLVLVLPLIGSLIYLFYSWASASRRAVADAGGRPPGGDQASNAPDAGDDLASLDRLRRNGVLTEAEFEAGKRRVLEGVSPDGIPSATQTIEETRRTSATNDEPKHGAR